MDSHKSNIIWQSITLLISILLLFAIPCAVQFSEIIKEVLIGIVSAILLLLFIEIRGVVKEKKIYGYLNGEYKRITIFESNLTSISGTKYHAIDYAGIDSKIKFNYKGNRQYQFESQYKEGKINALIYLDQINPTEGIGFYQYLTKNDNSNLPDIGHYKLFVDSIDCKKLYIYYTNLIPSGLAQGYEIWEKL